MDYTRDLVIIGTSHHNTLSMVRCVGHEGVRPYVFIYGHKRSYIENSKYLAGYKFLSSAEDAVNALLLFCKDKKEQPVIITCSDEVAMILDQRYEEFRDICYFFNAGTSGKLTHFMDKQVQTILAKECGFTIPWSIEFFPEAVNFDEIQYPCIIKPKESFHGGKKIFICNNIKELKTSLLEFDPEFSVIIQQYIKGDYEEVIIGLSLQRRSIIPGVVRKHREYKGATTYSTVFPASKLPKKVVNASAKILDFIGYEGLWGIECIKDGDDYYFIELNLRNDATTYSMAVAGVNLPIYYYKSFLDRGACLEELKQVEVINSMVEFEDFNFVLKRKLSLRQWIKELKDCKCRYFLDKNDMSPYRVKRKEYFKFLINRLFNKTCN